MFQKTLIATGSETLRDLAVRGVRRLGSGAADELRPPSRNMLLVRD